MFYIKNVNKIGKVAEDSDREGDQADGCVLDTGVSAEYAEISERQIVLKFNHFKHYVNKYVEKTHQVLRDTK